MAVLYAESAGVSSQSLARWPLRLHDAHTCRNLHEPGNAQQPLFHEAHMRSRVSGLTARLPAGGGAADAGDIAGIIDSDCAGDWNGCSDARAH